MSTIVTRAGFAPDIWKGTDLPALADYTGGPALRLEPGEEAAGLAGQLAGLKLVVIPFASSGDGRGFSLAAELRAMGFTGHIRASGHVLVDQFRAALRAGFTDIEISDAQAARNPEAQWLSVPLTEGYRARLFAA